MPAYRDLTGKYFGHLIALADTGQRENGYCVWRCACDCGKEADITESALVSGASKSCGCLQRENRRMISKQLHMVDGTCVEWLEKRKHRRDNTSGFRGVYKMKDGRYRVDIGFKGKYFYLGIFDKLEDAAAARVKAEKEIYDRFIEAYREWEEKASANSRWKEENPFVFEVEKRKAKRGICHHQKLKIVEINENM